jgi:Na+-transporting methylmalonyl-CoA/oxaloacetate decarboxylase gamma subunit
MDSLKPFRDHIILDSILIFLGVVFIYAVIYLIAYLCNNRRIIISRVINSEGDELQVPEERPAEAIADPPAPKAAKSFETELKEVKKIANESKRIAHIADDKADKALYALDEINARTKKTFLYNSVRK